MKRMMMYLTAGAMLAGPLAAFAAGEDAVSRPGNGLQEPFQLKAAGETIDMTGGFSTPFVTDWDGDGKADLLLGGGRDVRLRIYRNKGNSRAPVFDGFTYFEAGGKPATVPDGFG
jgi:hypothetical protein